MVKTRIRKLLRRRHVRADHNGLLLTERHFKAALHRERLRSDRSLTNFSLITIEFGKRSGKDGTFAAALKVLEQRVRKTDLAGRFGPRTIGIILPDTVAKGARTLADELRGRLDAHGISPAFKVFIYPSFETPAAEATQQASEHRVSNARGESTEPLESLFVQKLPLWKRTVDIAGVSVGLVCAAPIMLMAAVAIKLTSKGPIFYSQKRDGIGGRQFHIYKFRTMIVNADAIKAQLRKDSEQDGPAFKLKNDPRVTKIGRLLRRTCVDELPQLFNVLRGDMSIVGPRPMCSREAQHCASWERRRLDVTPGLTCIWQVEGGTKVTFREWMRMDLRYVRSRTLWKDLRLMAMTVPSVIRRDGVY